MAETQILMSVPSRILPGTVIFFPDGSTTTVPDNRQILVPSGMVPFLLSSGFIEMQEGA